MDGAFPMLFELLFSGAVIALATFELVRTRRRLARTREEEARARDGQSRS
jgi:hypothetical protein